MERIISAASGSLMSIITQILNKADTMSSRALQLALQLPSVNSVRKIFQRQIPVPREALESSDLPPTEIERIKPHRRGNRGYVNFGSAIAVSRGVRNNTSRMSRGQRV